ERRSDQGEMSVVSHSGRVGAMEVGLLKSTELLFGIWTSFPAAPIWHGRTSASPPDKRTTLRPETAPTMHVPEAKSDDPSPLTTTCPVRGTSWTTLPV